MVCDEFAGEGLVTETGTNREEQGPMRRAARLVRHYAGVMAHEFDSVPADDAEVLGILAYSSLAFMTRLAKDGEQAPTFEAHVEHARMLHVGLERGGLLAVLRQARHKRERRIGENTKDFGIVGGDGIKLVCHDSSIVPDKPRGPPHGTLFFPISACLCDQPLPRELVTHHYTER